MPLKKEKVRKKKSSPESASKIESCEERKVCDDGDQKMVKRVV